MFHVLRELLIAVVILMAVMFAIAFVAALFNVRPSDTGGAALLVKTAMLFVPTILAGYVLARRI